MNRKILKGSHFIVTYKSYLIIRKEKNNYIAAFLTNQLVVCIGYKIF